MQIHPSTEEENQTQSELCNDQDKMDSNLKIIFYLHVPFPSYEMFRQLPLRTSLLRGILASDVIGTHTYSSARHLISTCCRHLGITKRVQRVGCVCC